MVRINLQQKFSQLAILILVSFIWGSSFILMKKGLETYNNYQVAAFRIFFSFVLLLPFAIKKLKLINSTRIIPLIVVGFLGFGIPALLFTTAQTHINSSLAAMLNSTTPFFTLLIGTLFFKSKSKIISIIGVIVGFIGAMGLIVKDTFHFLSSINGYASLAMLATLCYGINLNVVKTRLTGLTGLEITSLGMMFVGPIAGSYLLFSDFTNLANSGEKWENLLYVFILASFGTVIAQIIFNNLLRFTSALFASSVTYIIPVFAILWGIADGEVLSVTQLMWIALILFGVYLVNKK